jgi:tyrosine-protein kinase Etk/Wzc
LIFSAFFLKIHLNRVVSIEFSLIDTSSKMDEPATKPIPNRSINLLDYIIVLAKQSRLIIYTTAAVTVLTYLYLFCSPNMYKAKARILPPDQNMTLSAHLLEILGGAGVPGRDSAGPLGTMGSLGGMAGGMLGLRPPGALYVAMMTGDTISDRIINRFNLRQVYKITYFEDARKSLRSLVKINAGPKDGLISIEVTSKDPKLAASMANAYKEELDKLLQEMAVQEAADRLHFLEKERGEANIKLTKAEEALKAFSEQNSVIMIDAQARGALEYISRLRAEIDVREVQMQVFRQEATRFNYDVIRLETEISGLKEKLRAAESKWDQNCVGDVCLTTSKVPTLALEYIRLYREAKFLESVTQLFSKMAEIARMDMVKRVAFIQMVDKASPPERRSNQRLLPALQVGIITFLMMIFVAFVREYWQNSGIAERESGRLALIISYLKPRTNIMRNFLAIFRKKKK